VALATAHWARVSSLRWPCTLVAALVMVAEVGDGVAWASDALAGAWIGFATALAVPWAWWMRQRSLDVEAAPPSTVRP
jgi:membrane-associated phospholipid phosphatase